MAQQFRSLLRMCLLLLTSLLCTHAMRSRPISFASNTAPTGAWNILTPGSHFGTLIDIPQPMFVDQVSVWTDVRSDGADAEVRLALARYPSNGVTQVLGQSDRFAPGDRAWSRGSLTGGAVLACPGSYVVFIHSTRILDYNIDPTVKTAYIRFNTAVTDMFPSSGQINTVSTSTAYTSVSGMTASASDCLTDAPTAPVTSASTMTHTSVATAVATVSNTRTATQAPTMAATDVATDVVAQCAADSIFPATPVGSTATAVCHEGFTGTQSRECGATAVWGAVDTSACVPVLLANTVFRGNVLYTSGRASDAEECHAMCEVDVLCRGSSFWQHSGWCSLFSNVQSTTTARHETTTSVYSMASGKCSSDTRAVFDVSHSTVLSIESFAPGKHADLCCTACHNDARCVAWNYKWKGKCVLLSADAGDKLHPNKWSMSGRPLWA